MNSRTALILEILVASRRLGDPYVGRTVLVKLAFLSEILKPVYDVWFEGFQFVRYHYGPYSDDIHRRAEFLAFHSLAQIGSYEKSVGRVAATYSVTDAGEAAAKRLRAASTPASRLAEMVGDIVWSLRGLGATSAAGICRLVYAEPDFAQRLSGAPSEAANLRNAEQLPSPLWPSHASFQAQAVLRYVIKKNGDRQALNSPREMTRTYLTALAAMSRKKTLAGSVTHDR